MMAGKMFCALTSRWSKKTGNVYSFRGGRGQPGREYRLPVSPPCLPSLGADTPWDF